VRLGTPLALATEGTRFLTLVAKVVERELSRSPGANVSWVDRLDQETTPQQNATQAQPVLVKRDSLDVLEDGQLLGSKRDEDGERGRNRTFNLLIKSHPCPRRPSFGNSHLTNDLQKSYAHRGSLVNA